MDMNNNDMNNNDMKTGKHVGTERLLAETTMRRIDAGLRKLLGTVVVAGEEKRAIAGITMREGTVVLDGKEHVIADITLRQ